MILPSCSGTSVLCGMIRIQIGHNSQLCPWELLIIHRGLNGT